MEQPARDTNGDEETEVAEGASAPERHLSVVPELGQTGVSPENATSSDEESTKPMHEDITQSHVIPGFE